MKHLRNAAIILGLALALCLLIAVAVRAATNPLPPVRQHLECSDYYGNGYTVTIRRYRTEQGKGGVTAWHK